jgi:uncharacterized membrane protein YqiK
MLDNFLPQLTWLIPALLGGAVFLFFLSRWLVNVGPTQIAITERRYLGKKLRAGRAFATDGEVGIQAQYLTPGLHFVAWPFVTVIKKADFVVIGSDELGIITAVDGDEMPAGRVFAEDKAGEHHDNFQDPVAFLGRGGIRGKQLLFLTNGTFKIHPLLFSVKKIKKTVIAESKIGVITAADGAALRDGQLLGMRVEEHDNFQKAEIFLKKGGQKGPQIDFLRPGTYNIFDEMFQVEQREAIYVREDQVGIVDAKDGEPMGKDDVVAATPDVGRHNSYQDGQAFLSNNGKRGPQESVLRPGVYYINPYLFNVTMKSLTVIKQGECGVLISNIGQDPSKLDDNEPGSSPVSTSATDPEESRLDKGVRGRHVVPDGFRGIQKNVLMPGKYNINPLAYTVIPIPTTTRSVEWSENKGAQDFDPFSVVSNDGFEMKVEVRCQYRILPENAPYVVQKLGSIEELEKNVIHPQIDGMFRAQVSKSPAIKYQQERAKEQTEAEEAVRNDLTRYKVEIVSVMICNIKLPQELMHTTQERNLAEQRKAMFDSQREAEVRRIELEKTKSQADQQKAMMEAQTGIEIAKSKALQVQEAARGEAEATKLRAAADAEATKLRAAADAEKTTKTGLAQAEVIQKQGEAQAEAYRKQAEALTPEGLAAIELARKFTEAKTVLTPEILIQSGGGNGGGNGGISPMVELLLAQQLRNGLAKTAEKDKGAPAPEPKEGQK